MSPYPKDTCPETEFHEVVMYTMVVSWLFWMLMLRLTEAYRLQETDKGFEDPIYQIINMLKVLEMISKEHLCKGTLSRKLVSLLVVLA